MTNNKQLTEYTYWKRPWQKWLVFIGGISQIIALFLNVQDCKQIAGVKDLIFSAAEWENYALQQSFQIAINGILAAIFLGCFLIGITSRSKKEASMAEGLLLLIISIVWGFVGLIFQFTTVTGTAIIWSILLVISFCGSIYSFYKIRKK